jgi:hypothetical protein
MYRENPDYVLSWLTHGLLEADVALADDSGRALRIARGMIDWFSSLEHNWLLPEFMPPDRTTGDVPPVYGANTGHQIYLISQGIIHHTRMATSPLGKQRDVDVVAQLYQEDEWLAALQQRDDRAIWQKHWFPHNYEVTAFEAYLDMYSLTGNNTYLESILAAWAMFRESFLHVGGAMALNEGSHGTNLSLGLWYPPKSYYLEGAASTGFQRKHNPHISGETCGSVFWVKLNQRFHRIFPTNESFVAEIERSLLNIGIANQAAAVGSPLAGVRSFALLHGQKNKIQNISTCCEGQGTRLHGSLPEYIFSTYSNNSAVPGVSVNIWAAAAIEGLHFGTGTVVSLSVTSTFPYPQPAGQPLKLTIGVYPSSSPAQVAVPINDHTGQNVSAQFEVALRIPSWISRASVTIKLNGRSIGIGRRGSFFKLQREFQDRDEISLELPMGFRTTHYVGFNQINGSKRVAYEFGPSLLVALPSSTAAWNNATDCLHVRGVNASSPDSWLQPEGSKPPLNMRFKPHVKSANDEVAPVTFVPYFSVNDELMTAYPAYDAV